MEEGAEGNMCDFIARLLKTALGLSAEEDLGIEHAHRSLVSKPTAPNASRSIMVKFLHFQTKQRRILFKCWNMKTVEFEGSRIRLDDDYSVAVQRRHMEYGEIKQP